MNIGNKTVGAFNPVLLQPSSVLLQVEGPEVRIAEVQRLVGRTKEAAASVAACAAAQHEDEAGRPAALLQTGEKVVSGERAAPNCTVDMVVEVAVGNATKKYSPPREIMSGNHAPYPCADIHPGYKNMFWLSCLNHELKVDASQCLPNGQDPEQCKKEKDTLEEVYVETYVELSRLVAEYEDLANSTACHDIVMNKFKTKRAPISQAADELTEKVTDTVQKLQEQRPILDGAKDAQDKLQKHVDRLGEKCAELPMTTSDLHKVRKAIDALSLCPGLSRPSFYIPKWTGEYIVLAAGEVDGTAKTDADIDKALNFACINKFGTESNKVRAASTAEIEAVSVEDQPRNNTALVPILGTCPHCSGNVDGEDTPKHKSGHARICWDPEADLTSKGKRTDCTSGEKAAFCVYDRGDIRKSTTAAPQVANPPAEAPQEEAAAAPEEQPAEEQAAAAPEEEAAPASFVAEEKRAMSHHGRAHKRPTLGLGK